MSKILAATTSHDARSKRSEVLGPKTATPALPFFILQKINCWRRAVNPIFRTVRISFGQTRLSFGQVLKSKLLWL